MRIFVSILMFCLVMFSVSAATADDRGRKTSKTRQITGTVTGINVNDQKVTLKKKNTVVVLNIEGKTKIVQCEKSPRVSSIHIGDKITAQYTQTPSSNIAKTITIRE